MRAERAVPLYVPVSLGDRLFDCFSVKISRLGIALSASLRGEAAPEPDDVLHASLEVGGAGGLAIESRVRVEWVQRRSARGGWLPSVLFGGSFERPAARVRDQLERFVSGYRPRVAVIGARPADVARLASELADLEIVALRSVDEFHQVVPQPPLAVTVVVGHDDRALAFLESLGAGGLDEVDALNALSYATLAPRIVFQGPARADRLLALHNAAKLFRSVAGDDGPGLLAAIRAGVEDFALRSELGDLGPRPPWSPPPARSVDTPSAALASLVYASAPMQQVVEQARWAAQAPIPVLVRGETGTGKEILARALHELGPRAAGPFVAHDCAVLPESLLDSELFGHQRGAFTGAIASHAGLFAAADGGTLFLDEIENAAPGLQARLLRVLESGEVRPLGSVVPRRVDVRVIAATNRDLLAEVRRGTFRADLYYRLEGLVLELPPLRDRRDDILPIARALAARACARLGRPLPAFDEDFERALLAHDWPGNVRELRNVVERAIYDSAGRPGHARPPAAAPVRSLRAQLDERERELLTRALADSGDVVRAAARSLGMDPVTLARRARRLGVTLGRK